MALSFENPKEYIAELIGTMILVAVGCFAGAMVYTNYMIVGYGGEMTAITFALTYIGLIFCIGKFSNCHFNPLISLSMFISGKMRAVDTLWYVLAQLIGGIIGAIVAFLTLAMAYDTWDIVIFPSTYGGYFGRAELLGAIIVEFFLAFALSYIAMKATDSKKIDIKSGAIISVATFVLIWVFGFVTYSAINPAKSLGAAIAMMFSGVDNHFEPLIQIWLFIIIPALGALVGTFLYMMLESGEFDLNKYLSAVKKKKSEGDEVDYTEEAEYSEEAVEETAEEPAAEEIVDEPVEEIPEIESVEEDVLPEVESVDEESAPEFESEEKIAEDSETKTE